jgi:hypothetical protein
VLAALIAFTVFQCAVPISEKIVTPHKRKTCSGIIQMTHRPLHYSIKIMLIKDFHLQYDGASTGIKPIAPALLCFACHLLHSGFLVDLLFESEDGGDMFLRNVG